MSRDTRGTLNRRGRQLLAVLAVGLAAGCSSKEREQQEVKEALRASLAAARRPAFVTGDAEGRQLWNATRQFYERREHAPAWVDGRTPGPQIDELIAALRSAEQEGLDPQLYSLAFLEQKRAEATKGFLTSAGFDPAEAGALDALLTYLYLKYASDLADGMSDLARVDESWQIEPEQFDAPAHLERAIEEERVGASLAQLVPTHPQYVALKKTLAEYRTAAAAGGWPAVPAIDRLKPGGRSPHVGALARRLAASGDYTGPLPQGDAPMEYGAALQGSVKRFQRRHGLPEDAIVTSAVVREMNVPIERRIDQIALNLERWRWLPRDLGERYVLVNIPEYRLEVWEGTRVPLSMRVVVGKPDTPTPIFNDRMTYLVFSPYWNVPPDIMTGETLPAVMKDPGFLERTNMEVVDTRGRILDPATIDLADPTHYRFRQRPGADNSLGLVKFMFPNEYNVYLHDTPADSLFARASRSFSHGCVRVENPVALAQYVLRDQPEWTRERIDEAMHAYEERVVKLRGAIPVYLAYWTARVSADGLLQLRGDVYGIDKRQRALLATRVNRLKQTAAAAAITPGGPKKTTTRPGANIRSAE